MLTPTTQHISKYMKIQKIWNYYLSATAAYGFTRAVTYRYEKNKEYYNEKTHSFENKPMLQVDQAGRIVWHSWASIFGWPMMLAEDVRSFECYLRGKDPKEYA